MYTGDEIHALAAANAAVIVAAAPSAAAVACGELHLPNCYVAWRQNIYFL